MMLSDHDRARLAVVADVLVPRSERMPSASEAGIAGKPVDDVLAARPDLVEPLRIALDWPNSPDTLPPEVFAALGEIVAGAYFQIPEVQDRIGYHGRAALPVTELTGEDRALLEPVVHRGRIYRDDPR
jgi:hypothetical protein